MKVLGHEWKEVIHEAEQNTKENLIAKYSIIPILMEKDIFTFGLRKENMGNTPIANDYYTLVTTVAAIIKTETLRNIGQKIYYAINVFTKRHTCSEYIDFYTDFIMQLNIQKTNDHVGALLLHVLITDFYQKGIVRVNNEKIEYVYISEDVPSLLDYIMLLLGYTCRCGSRTKFPIEQVPRSTRLYIVNTYTVLASRLLSGCSMREVEDTIANVIPALLAYTTYNLFPIDIKTYSFLEIGVQGVDEYDTSNLMAYLYMLRYIIPKDILFHRKKVLNESGVTLRITGNGAYSYIHICEKMWKKQRYISVCAYDHSSSTCRSLLLDISDITSFIKLSDATCVDYEIIWNVLTFYGVMDIIQNMADIYTEEEYAKVVDKDMSAEECHDSYVHLHSAMQHVSLVAEKVFTENHYVYEVPHSWTIIDSTYGNKSSSIVLPENKFIIAKIINRKFRLFPMKQKDDPSLYLISLDKSEKFVLTNNK